MKLVRIIALVLCGFISASALGANLLEVYTLAAENDAILKAEKFLADARALDREITLASVLPTLSFGAQYQDRRNSKNIDSTSSFSEATLSIPLYTSALKPSLGMSESNEAVAQFQYRKAQHNLYRRVVNAYFEILAAKDNLETTTSQVKAITEFLKITRERSSVGLGTETDVQNALAREALANATAIRDESAIESAWLSLVEITGERPAELERLNDELELPKLLPNDANYWVDLAVKSNLDLAIQREVVKSSNLAILLAGASTGPNVSLAISYKDHGDKPSGTPEKSLISLRVSKSFSLAGHSTKLKNQAVFQHKAQVQKLHAATQQIKSKVSSAYFNIISLFNRIKALESAKIASKSALDATDQGYLVGTLTSVDVLNAQHDLFQVSRDLHRARYDYLQNSAVLRELTGTLGISDLEVMNGYLN